jgi:hypothetical protein
MIARVTATCTLVVALAVVSVAAAAPPRAGQGRPVSGIVVDEHSGTAISGVRVRLAGLGVETVSQGDGRFVFDAVPPGRYRLVLVLDGFRVSARHPGL